MLTPPLRLLWVATKSPWPPIDGGRVLMAQTIDRLAGRGVEIDLVAPHPKGGGLATAREHLRSCCIPHLVPTGGRRWVTTLLGWLGGRPLAVGWHRHPRVRRTVADLLASSRFSAVHVEQAQAMPAVADAPLGSVPVMLRAQNVESDIWSMRSESWRPRRLWERERRRFEQWEGGVVGQASLTVAVSEMDAERLCGLSGRRGRVEHVPVPFPSQLPAGPPLPGRPALVVAGSGGWRPNAAGERWFLEQVWPVIRRAVDGAQVHHFGTAAGDRTAAVTGHDRPADSRDLFGEGSVLIVPLRDGSGVRVKILEAWARGIPVVATQVAVAGLGAADDRELLIAETPDDFARQVGRLAADPSIGDRLTAAGRSLLARRHDPERVTERYLELYREVIAAAEKT